MANRMEPLVQYLRQVARPAHHAHLTDGELLGRFIATRDEAAFEALVRRHAPMVFAVCQRVARNRADAEDAFQSTFLVLVRKARSISCRETVGNWLYGVAFRTAQRVRAAGPVLRERQVSVMPEIEAKPENRAFELQEVLDQELNSLPEKYRLPVVLCELEGRSRKEVAHQLGIPEGTLSWRLARARKLLAKRLAKYGPFSGAALAAALTEGVSAAVPSTIITSTVKTVLAGGGATVATLAAGVIKTMYLTKLKSASWAVALVVMAGASVAGLRVATAESSPVADNAIPTSARRNVRDELDVLRLEIAALRKDLRLTKERVQALEQRLRSDKSGAEVMQFNTPRFRIPIRVSSERRGELKQIDRFRLP